LHIVQYIEYKVPCFRYCCFGQGACPIGIVHVSTHGNHGCEFPQVPENFWLAHVTGVENQLGTPKGFQRLWPQQAMSIRDQPNTGWRSVHGEILKLRVLEQVKNSNGGRWRL